MSKTSNFNIQTRENRRKEKRKERKEKKRKGWVYLCMLICL